MYKRCLSRLAAVLCFLALCFLLQGSAAQRDVTVFCNGEQVEFSVAPQIVSGYTMVPLRDMAEILHGYIREYQTRMYTLAKSGTYLGFEAGKKQGEKNGGEYALPVAPVLVSGKMMVPLRAIADVFDMEITWDAKAYRVDLKFDISFHYYFKEECAAVVSAFDQGLLGDEIYFLPSNGEEDILLYRKGETMYLKTFGDFQRTRTRTLSEEEQSAFKTFIAENKIDQLADYEPAVLDGIFAQYVHCSKEGRSSFYINNPWPEISEAGEMHYELLLQFFKLLSSGTFDVHYETEKTVPGLEVLIKGEDHEIEAVWKDGDDMRVQVKEPNEPGNYKDIYHWYVFRDGEIAERAETPGGMQPEDAWADIPKEHLYDDYLNNYPWNITWKSYRVRAMRDEYNQDALYLTKEGEKPKLITHGTFAYPIVIPGSDYAVCAYAEHGWAKPNTIVTVNLKTFEITPLDIPADDELTPCAYFNGLVYIQGIGVWYTYDLETDTVTKLSIQPSGLSEIRERNLQPTQEENVYYTVGSIQDASVSKYYYVDTIGKLDINTLAFTPILACPGLQFDAMDLWVDEKENVAYIAHWGDLLRIPLP